MTPEQELLRAREAQRLLDDPLFQEARKNLEMQLAGLRRAVPIHEGGMHTRLILMEQLSDKFFAYFEQLAQTGKFANIKLQEEEQRKASMKERLLMFAQLGRNAI